MTSVVAPGGEDGAQGGPAAQATAGAPEHVTGQAEVESMAVTSGLGGLVRAAVRDELDGILPHVVAAIKRDRAFDELSDRLSNAERLLAARRERPLAVAVHRLLNRLRHLDFDQAVKTSLADELVKILADAGFEETGRVGEDYDPSRHEALSGRATDGMATVTEVDARGLSSFGDVVVRAQVKVAPRTDTQPKGTAPAAEEPLPG
jgi:hypothetical protein